VSSHGRYAEAGTDLKARAFGKSYDPGRRKICVLLRGSRRPLVAGEIYPNTVTHSKIPDAVTYGIDHTRTVLVRCDLWKRRGCPFARSKARLPVSGVDAGDNDTDTDLVRARFGDIPIHEPKHRRVAGARVDNRPHDRDDPTILAIIPGPTMPSASDMQHSMDLTAVESVKQPTSLICRDGGEFDAPTTSLLDNLGHDR
jgi:hypothetical protein